MPRQLALNIETRQAVLAQLAWIDSHGGSLNGYIEFYEPHNEDQPGGGRAHARRIYEADMARLHQLQGRSN